MNSWPALGAHLAAREPPLRSLSAALHDMRYFFGPVGCRLTQASMREFLRTVRGRMRRRSIRLCCAPRGQLGTRRRSWEAAPGRRKTCTSMGQGAGISRIRLTSA
jgi:hypothetical protein